MQMTDTTNDNDIDALLRYLKSGHTPHWYEDSTRWHAALTALVAERDRSKELHAHLSQSYVLLAEDCDALKERIAELEAHPSTDRDLRERLVCAAMHSIAGMSLHGLRWDECGKAAAECADAAISAMRKGATNER